MSHLDPQPEDDKDLISAKALVTGQLSATPQETLRLLEHVLDDRSNWVAKAAELRDSMIDVVHHFNPGNKTERDLISLMAGQSREVSAMLNPPVEKVIAFGQRQAG